MTDAGQPTLQRRLSLPLLALYGLGTTVGAGIYALLGEVVASAGTLAPVSFIVASIMAGLTGFTFAELASRMPRSAGEAVYANEAFGTRVIPLAVGLLVVFAGTVSAAAISNGFVGYFEFFVAAPRSVVIFGLVVMLALVATWGIGESVLVAAALTVVEIGGLFLAIAIAGPSFADLPARAAEFVPPIETGAWLGIFGGSFLAFFAFLGFEDMVNVAEETKDPTRTLPRAIILTLGVTTVLYVLVTLSAILAVDLEDLAASDAPLALLFERSGRVSPNVISAIGVIAIINGGLIQIIMASRVLYGLASQGLLPRAFGRVQARTRTPVFATACVGIVVLILALALDIAPLARATAAITLIVFAIVNLALWRIKVRDAPPVGLFTVPLWVPITGFLVSVGFLVGEALRLVASG